MQIRLQVGRDILHRSPSGARLASSRGAGSPCSENAVLQTEFDVAVLGAGIVGAATAWHLGQRGARVVVLDATGPAAAASGASDGAVSVASKKPGVLARLATEALLYTRILAQDGPLARQFHARPSWYFATNDAELEALDALRAKLQMLDGPVRIGQDGGADLLAGLGASVRRLVEIRGEGHMTGYGAVRAYLDDPRIARRWPAAITAIAPDDTGVTLAVARGKELRVGRVVVALGVSTPALFPDLPVHPLAGHLVITDRGQPGALAGALTAGSYLIAKTETGTESGERPVVIDPLMTGQMLIGSSRVPEADAARMDFTTILHLVRRAAAIWPALTERRVIRAFVGVRAAVQDGLPIVGPINQSGRVVMATGFEGDGICLSSLIGREVAAMALGLAPTPALDRDLAALSPTRFIHTGQEAAQ
jgi:glycine/D-amino acid oxidase-like deaminating enzyme